MTTEQGPFSNWFGWLIEHIKGSKVKIPNYLVFLSMKIVFTIASSVEPDEKCLIIWASLFA